MPRHSEVTGYVLAGGKGTRMGRDKAEILLQGKAFLDHALEKLTPLCGEVVVVGDRPAPGPEVRVIPDRFAGCGPLGGIEAALSDLVEYGREWAFFLPVDMPLLPESFLDALLELWREAPDARVCYLVVEGVAQPLVSLLHRDALLPVREALAAGRYKATPVLDEAAGGSGLASLRRTEMETGMPNWSSTTQEAALRLLWFSNLNTPEELREAEDLCHRNLRDGFC